MTERKTRQTDSSESDEWVGKDRLSGVYWLNRAAFEFAVVHHEHAQSEILGDLGVTGGQLFLVVVEIKIERVPGINVDQHQVGVVHGQFAKAQAVAAEGHVILCRNFGPRIFLRRAEDLDDVVALKPDIRYLSGDVWRRENLARIKNDIILLHLHSADFTGLDQIGQVQAKQVHEPFYGQMQCADLVRMQANLAVGGCAQLSLGLETHVVMMV